MQSSRFALKTRIMVIVSILAILGVLIASLVLHPSMTVPAVPMHFDRYWFNSFGVVSAIAALINGGLLVYFINKPARTPERIWLTIYIASVTVFVAATAVQQFTADPGAALFWANFAALSIGAPAVIYLFALTYTNQTERHYTGLTALLVIGSLGMVFFEEFSTLLFNNSLSTGVLQAWGWDFRGGIGSVGAVVVVWYYGLMVAALLRLISFRRQTRNPILRSQSLVFIAGLGLLIAGGLWFDFIFPSLNISVPPLTPLLSVPTALILVYGVLRYRLLTINPALFSDTILGIMKEAVVVTDKDFHVLYTNPKAQALLALRTGDPERTSLLPHLTPDSVEILRSALVENQNDEVTVEGIEVAQAHQKTPVRITASQIRYSDFQAWVLILTDITAELHTRRTIEHEVQVRTRELNEARAYLVSSISSLEQGFVLVDHSGKIVLANTVVAKLLSMDNDSLVGGAFGEAIAKLPLTVDLGSGVTRVLQTHHAKRYTAVESNGSFFDIYLTPVMNDEANLGATIIIQDVTEAKIMERSKDEFFSIASHELRTPLTAIRGNMSMAKDYFADQLKDPTLHDLVYDSHAAAIRLIEIVNDFLDSSRLEQGKMVFAIVPTQLAPIIAGVMSDLQILSDQQHNKLVIDSSVEKLPLVMADGARLRQVIYNLMSNANKYSENATITISGEVEGTKAKVRVSDTGKGITPEGQKRLFHKFLQAGDSNLTRDNTKGTGLGLYISRLLASGMHGNVELESSEVGKGSIFVVTIPVAPTHAKMATPPATVPSAGETTA